MNLDLARAGALADAVRSSGEMFGPRVEIAVFPPYTAIAAVHSRLIGTPIRVGGQDCSAERDGAFTGQVSAAMLRDASCSAVLIGHSERRHGLGEGDALFSRKLSRAVESGLVPVLCVGETLQERESGAASAVLVAQLRGALSEHGDSSLGSLVVAYEPVWAIGTGRTATPEDAAAAHRVVRQTLSDMYSARFAEQTRVIYGGSVNAKNAAELFACEEIDGGLVGGASLVAADFAAITAAAASAS